MHINRIHLKNYRTHIDSEFLFSPVTTFVVGDNAVGKTNLLEAVALLTNAKPLRGRYDHEVIFNGNAHARVEGEVTQGSNERAYVLDLFIERKDPLRNTTSKKVRVNKAAKTQTAFAGHLQAVPFLPEHLETLTGSPNIRRRSLDLLFTQYDREYLSSKREYDKVMRNRNRLLEQIRDRGVGAETLSFWNDQLVLHGGVLQEKRKHFIEYLQDYFASHISDIDPKGGDLSVEYVLNTVSHERIAEHHHAEVASKRTLVGPHRDDLSFLLNGREVAHFASRGEQRSVMLLWKLAEVAYLKERTGQRPILLLDDIFSEFDSSHREKLFSLLGKQQTIITTTDISLVPDEYLVDAQIIEL